MKDRRVLSVLALVLAMGACRGGSFRCDPSPSWSIGAEPDASMPMRLRCDGECAPSEVVAGPRHTCLDVYPDGEVVCFGANEAGQSAPHVDAPRVPPTRVGQRANPWEDGNIAAGDLHACALHDGATVCWGSRDVLGGPDREPRVIETTLVAAEIASAALHTCITAVDPPTSECFGAWDGIDPATPAHVPRRRETPTWGVDRGFSAFGGLSECRLLDWPTDDAAIRYFPHCRGGVPPPGPLAPGDWNAAPTRMNAPTGGGGFWMATGPVVTCAQDGIAVHFGAREPGGVACIGDGRRGALGDGTLEQRPYVTEPARAAEPLEHPCVGGRVEIVRGEDGLEIGAVVGGHVCARGTDSLWCWGANDRGQLGDGTTEDRATPVRVEGLPPGGFYIPVCGGEHTCVLTNDHGLWCWGDNRFGQLGVEGPELRATPARVLIGGAFE